MIFCKRELLEVDGSSGIMTCQEIALLHTLTCIDFQLLGGQNGPAPFVDQGVRFTPYGPGSSPLPNWEVPTWGTFTGLNCGFELDIVLPSLAHEVRLSLVHFNTPAIITGYDVNGNAVTATMSSPQQVVDTILLTGGAPIRNVRVSAPQDETLLLEFCF